MAHQAPVGTGQANDVDVDLAVDRAAGVPQLPTTPGRFLIPQLIPLPLYTDDPVRAQRVIAVYPHAWQTWHHEPDVACVHDCGTWQMWTDYSLTSGVFLPAAGASRPMMRLSGPAETMLEKAALARNSSELPAELPEQLLRAAGHIETVVAVGGTDRDKVKCPPAWLGSKLCRHEIKLVGGTVLTLWEVWSYAGGRNAGTARWHNLFTVERCARARYEQERGQDAG